MKKTKHFIIGFLSLLFACSPAWAEWSPVEGKMMTEWGRQVTPENTWREYPRPQLVREDWTNLNGLWNYAITAKDVKTPEKWDGEILVPFAPEASLSGVGRLLEPKQTLWYERDLPAATAGKNTLLHFEAVDYETTVWVNGTEVGSHKGGHTPFSFDITKSLKTEGNKVLVRVHDATEGFQLHGKQKLQPGGIWYTRVSGIWQTVWLENVPKCYIDDLNFEVKIDGSLTVSADLAGDKSDGDKLRVTAMFDGKEVGQSDGSGSVSMKIPEPKLWSPTEPNLYDLKVELVAADDKILDTVTSYTALREFGKTQDANGNWRFTLNGKPIFHWGPLDQGWWPDGLLTPPSDAAMRFDVDFLKAAGFNMIRKHIKVEPSRYYAYLDKVGMLMWQDQVSMGYGPGTEPKGSNPDWTRLAPDPKDGEWPEKAHAQFVLEYKRMVAHLADHPCIAVWGPFNEAWGQHKTMEIGEMAVANKHGRAVNIASGGNFWPIGDIADEHAYPDPAFPVGDKRFDDYVKVVGEFGGHGWPVEGHLWVKDKANWGYGGIPKDLDEWKTRYQKSIGVLAGLRKRGISGGVYTQTSDVEVEVNGLLTYDRIPKVEAAWLKEQSDFLLDTPDAVDFKIILPTAVEKASKWQYTTEKPADGWEKADFDSTRWKSGESGFGSKITPGVKIGTNWKSSDIWLIKSFELSTELSGTPILRIFHDENAEVYLNGKKIATLSAYVTAYTDLVLPEAAILNTKGKNTLAIHCHQTQGGQYIDAGLFEEITK